MDNLTLYRRHTKTCLKGYPQNERVLTHQPSNKSERSKECGCPIQAEGTLSVEGFITNRSTKKTDWEAAEIVAGQWEAWGSTVEPEAEIDPSQVTVKYAVDAYLTNAGPRGRNVGKSTLRAFGVLLNQRLVPYAETKQYTLIRDFDNLDVVDKFFTSWENLQPTRNRKTTTHTAAKKLLGATTKKAELERLRQFFRFCIDRHWMKSNPAMKLKVSAAVTKKFGMAPNEEDEFFKAAALSQNAEELRAFCLVMRHAGLRISDAITLNDSQLVRRTSGKGSALKVYQKKTKEWVYIPVPDVVPSELGKLSFKGERNGRRYWFWTTEGSEKTAQNNWYRAISNVLVKVKKKITLRHAVSPHTFRHTFSISYLNDGMDIKLLSRLLGHKSLSVTEKHYAHAVHGTHLALDAAVDEALRRQSVA